MRDSSPTGEPGTSVPDRGSLRLLLALARQIAYKRVVLLVRYPVNTLGRFLTTLLFFLMLFYGGRELGGAAFDDSLGGLIVGFFLFTITVTAYSALAWNVTREAQWGTLEQLFLSPHGFGTVFVVKTIVNLIESFCWGFAMLAAMMLISGRFLTVDVATVVPIATLAVLSVVGVGFLFAGLALVYKRLDSVFPLVQFSFVGLIAAPTIDEPALAALPLVAGSNLLVRAMTEGTRLWEFPLADLALLVAVGVGYAALGYAAFYVAQRRARKLGVLGHY
ncbi:ABC transporter permease [Halosolutus gelatinilyticus]|uniref:ABC transporter permease n=1 Tax=Halosolutus gelatinilyticus TaxID=2931975 RepID=UPI001FF5E6B8|nr:ABC transporter permease [Halosolutus gelatinilyticus]